MNVMLEKRGEEEQGGLTFCQVAFFSASEFNALYNGSVMMARIV